GPVGQGQQLALEKAAQQPLQLGPGALGHGHAAEEPADLGLQGLQVQLGGRHGRGLPGSAAGLNAAGRPASSAPEYHPLEVMPDAGGSARLPETPGSSRGPQVRAGPAVPENPAPSAEG